MMMAMAIATVMMVTITTATAMMIATSNLLALGTGDDENAGDAAGDEATRRTKGNSRGRGEPADIGKYAGR